MDKQLNSLTHSAHLLDDLESIRELLGDADLQPPLLTETVEQIPLLLDEPSATAPVAAAAPAPTPAPEEDAQTRRQDTLLHLDAELRAAAQSIMQDVINDFTPHIETEIKRRLDARLERLLKRSE
ncbi:MULTISPECIES: DNA polymerase III subunit chi [Pseudomonas]|uniref:DNA polymerase III subunit chi n=1 Tax=Pseudomonas soli TaxID=1306993 RepID=A0A2V4I810_9PSED|nr:MULTISPECIES: DNA polymerase III subunit chi [Pseudomonas]PMZ98731.1 DNA polymerase III subunit chi [Pseudomonas sp. FW305-42]PNA19998.1 DNA polymerase III subunit chi [Pseudomonas sp. MPR-R1B]PNB18153.1 DNA polymerase III subunit chi [Pseudomonas sp. DP16D-E2]PNB42835.1 DNA polymerase III subunit chi [Pseudomonas sp. FW305-17]PNB60590.1 DNA polymerase III subunit chi [Pseudomonas sp. GW531-E2]